MSIEYKWSVAAMKCYPEYEGFENVVFTVHWRLAGKDGKYHEDTFGSVKLKLDPDHEYIPYEQLTQEQVLGWVKSAMDSSTNPQTRTSTQWEEFIAAKIEKQKNPTVVQPKLPWA
jgi:hypothetical protein